MFGKHKNKKVGPCLMVVLVVLLGFSLFGPATSAEAGVTEEWEVDILAPRLPGKWYSDMAFAPNGDLVYSVGSATRLPCDSFLGRIAPDGTLGEFATPCIDHPFSLAFTPWSGDAVVMIEGAGRCDTIYLVDPGDGDGQAEVFLSCSVVVNRDIQVAHDGSFFVADVYAARITEIRENKQVTYMDPAIPRLYDHETLRLAMDSAGTLYLAHRGTNTIYAYTDATLPREVYSTDFYRPSALATDADDNLWVAYESDPTFNIDILSPDGTITPWASGLPPVNRLEFGPDGLLYGIVGGKIVRFVQNTIEGTLDIDPDTLNLTSKGKWITCYIELPEGHDVSDIDVGSILLEHLLEAQRSDVQDGVLMVKFDRQDLIIYLEFVLGIIPPDDVTLSVTGELTDGTSFEGSDTIRVIDKGGKKE